MSAVLPAAADPRLRAAGRLRMAAAAVLAVMPFGMAIAHRSSQAFLVVAAVLALLAALLDGGWRPAARDASAWMRTPLGLAMGGFLGLAALSLAWSEVRRTSLHALGEFGLALVASLVFAAAMGRLPRPVFRVLAGAVALGAVLILFELSHDLVLHRALRMRFDSYIFNRSSLTLLALVIPLAAWAARGEARPADRLAVALAALLAVAAILRSDSGAAALGLAVAVAVFVVARLAPRAALWLAALGFGLSLALAPVMGDLFGRLLPAGLHQELSQAHSRERVDIWQSFGAAIREQPVLGGGFGSSARLIDTGVVARIPPDNRPLLGMGHPHNAAIQVWTELGVVGAALACLVLLLVLRRLWLLPAGDLAPALALLGAASIVSLIGHGAWQGWWASALGAAVIFMRSVPGEERG